MTDHKFEPGDRVRTSFEGEEFPGVYEIVGFDAGNGPGALLESADGDKTWCPISDLHLVTEPQPALSPRQKRKVLDFATFFANLKLAPAEAALTLLKSLLCLACGTPLTEKHPVCYCERDD